MNKQPVIVVVGATGAQGSSVARALLNSRQFTVRVLVKNRASVRALALQEAGAEVVQGDLEYAAGLQEALNGAYGVFGVINFQGNFDKEYVQGKNLLDAVHAADVQHLVFSTAVDYSKLLQGDFEVPHYDIKAALQEYAKGLKLPVSYVQHAFYYEQFVNFFPILKDEYGYPYFSFPDNSMKLPMASVEDIGPVVASIFNYPAEYIGRTVRVVGENLTCNEYAGIIAGVLQTKLYCKYIPGEEFAAFNFPGSQLDLIESYGLNPAMQPYKQWVTSNSEKFGQYINGQVLMEEKVC